MPSVYPFRAVQYKQAISGRGADVSALVAPPYDVLDGEGKARLLKQSAQNIVAVDLPHIPAKELGPPTAYSGAAGTLSQWLREGAMARREKPVMFVYRETFSFAGKTHQRTGMACTIETAAFGPRAGGGVLPHEETFSGPKEDRMALMKATAAQLSPIFGLHQDAAGTAAKLLTKIAASRAPDCVARTTEGGAVLHELWTVEDEATIAEYAKALAGEDVFIADGHHRYTTAINYLKGLEAAGAVGADHPARRCMIVLVSMSDAGMVIGPTHRVLGGMSGYSLEAFKAAAKGKLDFHAVAGDLRGIEAQMDAAAKKTGRNALGLYDFATRTCMIATPSDADALKGRFPNKPAAWRLLDVALVQYLVVEGIAQPALNGGQPVKWAFPHSIEEVIEIGEGKEKGSGGGKAFVPQIAVIVRPTPLESVRSVSQAGELMPQKSTFFYPKLATGLFVNPVAG